MANNEYVVEKSESSNAYVLVDTQLDLTIAAGSKKEMMRLMFALSVPAGAEVLYL